MYRFVRVFYRRSGAWERDTTTRLDYALHFKHVYHSGRANPKVTQVATFNPLRFMVSAPQQLQ